MVVLNLLLNTYVFGSYMMEYGRLKYQCVYLKQQFVTTLSELSVLDIFQDEHFIAEHVPCSLELVGRT